MESRKRKENAKKKRKDYPENDMARAVQLVKDGKAGYLKAWLSVQESASDGLTRHTQESTEKILYSNFVINS